MRGTTGNADPCGAYVSCFECQSAFPSRDDLVLHWIQTGHCLTRCSECPFFIVPDSCVDEIGRALHTLPSHQSSEIHDSTAEGIVRGVHAASYEHVNQTSNLSEGTTRAKQVKASESRAVKTEEQRGVHQEGGHLKLPSASEVVGSSQEAAPVTYRCMSCLNTFPTWTRLTKHIDSTEHTLSRCATCIKPLKCYGPLRPHRHTESTGHTGLWGSFNNRRDYAVATPEPRSLFLPQNYYTGYSVLQFECTCGVRFVSEAHLAIHLREAHHVDSISPTATCTTCQFAGTLKEMAEHLVATLDLDGALPRHEPYIHGVNALSFLVHRPISAVGPGVSAPTDSPMAAAAAGSTMTTTGDAVSPFVVFYQCTSCYLLFSAWDRVEQHMQITGHCRSYCADCHSFLPSLRTFGDTDKNRPTGQATHGGRGDVPVSLNLPEYLEHLQFHPNVLGRPASRESLEVLYHRQCGTCLLTPCAPHTETVPSMADRLDVPAETQKAELAKDDPVVFAFQCSTCNSVFLHYGELIRHLESLRHGERLGDSDETKQVGLSSPFPMLSYQVKFTAKQLCKNFGFVQCEACRGAFPPASLTLHHALCQQRWVAKGTAHTQHTANPH